MSNMLRLENIGGFSVSMGLDRSVVAFVNTHLKRQPGKILSAKVMHEAYASFLTPNQGEPIHIQIFAVQLQRLGQIRSNRRIGGKMTRLWENVVIVGLNGSAP